VPDLTGTDLISICVGHVAVAIGAPALDVRDLARATDELPQRRRRIHGHLARNVQLDVRRAPLAPDPGLLDRHASVHGLLVLLLGAELECGSRVRLARMLELDLHDAPRLPSRSRLYAALDHSRMRRSREASMHQEQLMLSLAEMVDRGEQRSDIALLLFLDDSGRMLTAQVVTIDGDKIVSVGPRGSGQQVTIDLGDVTLLPGLIDAHTHLAGGEELSPLADLLQTDARYASGCRECAQDTARRLRPCATSAAADLRRAARRDCRGSRARTRMLVAVSSLSSSGGHGDNNEPPADIKVLRYSTIADGPDEIRRNRENVKAAPTGSRCSRPASRRPEPIRRWPITPRRKSVPRSMPRATSTRRRCTRTAPRASSERRAVRSIEHCSMLDQPSR
jgi:hypothetical protein